MIVEESPLEITDDDGQVVPDPSIFRAYDIRGVVNQTLTPGVVRQIGRAIGSEAIQRGRNTVVVGRDMRLTSEEFADAVIRGGRVDPSVDLIEKPFTREALARRFECEIELENEIDERVIGGAVIYAGDEVIDGSLRGRLQKLSSSLVS